MEHPIRVAWCNLFYANNGGEVGVDGRPIRPPPEDEENKEFIRGLCDKAWDCGVCPILRLWVDAKVAEGWGVGWWCPDCVNEQWAYLKSKYRKSASLFMSMTAYYQSGRQERDPEDPKYDPDKPPLDGCTVCGKESSFLQLVFHRREPG